MSDVEDVEDVDDPGAATGDPFWDDEGDPAPLGAVLTDGRGSLPYALLHGESLVACAAWAMGAAEIELIDLTATWESVRATGRPVVLHDSLCPATPVDFLVRAVALARATDRVVVAARPVTDTLKQVVEGRVRAGSDRDTLLELASPVVLPSSVVVALRDAPRTDDAAALVEALADAAGTDRIEWCEAPASARRVADEDDLRLLEAATRSTT